MTSTEYTLMLIGFAVAILIGVWLTLLFAHLIMVKWAQATFAASTLAEAMGRARWYRWRCEQLEKKRPFPVRVEIIIDSNLSDEDKVNAIEMLISEGVDSIDREIDQLSTERPD